MMLGEHGVKGAKGKHVNELHKKPRRVLYISSIHLGPDANELLIIHSFIVHFTTSCSEFLCRVAFSPL